MLTQVITDVESTLQIVMRFKFEINQVKYAYSYHVESQETVLDDSLT